MSARDELGITEVLAPIRGYAEGRAVTARAQGRPDRDWLDLLILLDRASPDLVQIIADAKAEALNEAADERAAKQIAAGAADRFRDVLAEALGHADENPGDDVLVQELRQHFGMTGPEPTRWRDFCTGALAQVDQIAALTEDARGAPPDGGCPGCGNWPEECCCPAYPTKDARTEEDR